MARIHSHPVLGQQEASPLPIPERQPDPPPDRSSAFCPLESATAPPPAPEGGLAIGAEPGKAEESVTIVIVNFKTEHLLARCLASLRAHCPGMKVILVDNGSGDGSTELIREAGRSETVTAVLNDYNAGHGPALNQAIRMAETRYVFTMDTDCEILKGGFLEQMLRLFEEDRSLYALGWLRHVDWYTGVPAPSPEGFMPYIHPSAALYDRKKYLTLFPFVHQGAPATRNMREALEAGYGLCSFPIHEYVAHLEAGTRRMYGGRWDPGSDEMPGPWREDARYPI